jgi:hypothetical protein
MRHDRWSSSTRPAFYVATYLVLLCAASAYALGQELTPLAITPERLFDPSSDPVLDLRLAIAEAAGSGKRILLDVGGHSWILCHKRDRCFKMEEAIAGFLARHCIVARVNYSRENKNEKFLSQ